MKNNKFDIITKLEEMLEKSDLYWTVSYMPSSDSYCIYISEDDTEEYDCKECKYREIDCSGCIGGSKFDPKD